VCILPRLRVRRWLACLLTCVFCSAFHSSIVKVLLFSSGNVRKARYVIVGVVSHTARGLSSPLPQKKTCASNVLVSLLFAGGTKQAHEVLQYYETIEGCATEGCSRKRVPLRSHINVAYDNLRNRSTQHIEV